MKDLSVVLPYYKRIKTFKQSLCVNYLKLMSAPGRSTEVVLVLDEPTEESDVLELVSQYKQISWRVLINRRDHPWRNPSVAINVGIRHAKGAFVLIMSPECLYVTNVPAILFNAAHSISNSFAVGQARFCHRQIIEEKGLAQAYEAKKNQIYYGSICIPRSALESIRGYDESNKTWGGDDDNLRSRLVLSGLEKKCIANAKVIHPVDSDEDRGQVRDILRTKTWDERQACLFPLNAIANGEDWGKEFDEIIYEKEVSQKTIDLSSAPEIKGGDFGEVIDTNEIFENLIPQRLKEDNGSFEKIKGVCQIVITGDYGGSWMVDLTSQDGKVRATDEKVDCTIIIARQDLINIVNRKLIPAHAFVQGKARVTGNLKLAREVGQILVGE